MNELVPNEAYTGVRHAIHGVVAAINILEYHMFSFLSFHSGLKNERELK